ncbi:kinase-like protein [Gigaspora margarita]|uniref:Kinase-like protein n=1 Tax=Gigaspora margarita TaxID=4874 RepID=A0A8H4APD5_GIGMA|nr:kinase-like protein [Gigaspora margarita]
MATLNESLKEIIKENKLYVFDYNEFTNFEKIGSGGFGEVQKAYWKTRGYIVALKSLRVDIILGEKAIQEFIKELVILCSSSIRLHYHPNINQFSGIAIDYSNNYYYLILQYADGGNLRDYLKNNFEKLTWNDKLRIAKEIVRGLIHLHKSEQSIIHRDLHSKNILVHEGRMLIADFGMSKQLDVQSMSTNTATAQGMPAYMDPLYLIDHNYKRNEKSDIYSFGVILWEISSGHSPFPYKGRDELSIQVYMGLRETPVEGTPEKYVDLYMRCWDKDPEKRPDVQEVFDTLCGLMSEETEEHVPQAKALTIDVDIPPQLSPGASSDTNSSSDDVKSIPEIVKPLIKAQDDITSVTSVSNIIKLDHFALISSWINQTKSYKSFLKIFTPPKHYNITNFPYHFKLLIRGSRDGFSAPIFHRRCDNKGPTVTIIKVKDKDEILGGYNPFNWESPIESKYCYTTKSFIFSLDYNNLEHSIFSKAKHHESIKTGMHNGPYFRGDLCFSENFITGESYHLYYEKQIRSERKFSIGEYEVFQVIKYKQEG